MLVDIDNTVALSYSYEDTFDSCPLSNVLDISVNQKIRDVVNLASSEKIVIFISARPYRVYSDTVRWLNSSTFSFDYLIFSRVPHSKVLAILWFAKYVFKYSRFQNLTYIDDLTFRIKREIYVYSNLAALLYVESNINYIGFDKINGDSNV